MRVNFSDLSLEWPKEMVVRLWRITMRCHLRSMSVLSLVVVVFGSSVAMAARQVPKPNYDQPVSDFKLTDITGKVHQLSDYADRKGVVVTLRLPAMASAVGARSPIFAWQNPRPMNSEDGT